MRPYNPQTNRGNGIALPLAKSVGHLMAIHTAVRTERPLTAEQALSELHEAEAHMEDLQIPERLLSDASVEEINEFRENIRSAMGTMRTVIQGHLDTPMTTEDLPTLQQIVTDSWMILSLIDQELAGLPAMQSDPGKLP